MKYALVVTAFGLVVGLTLGFAQTSLAEDVSREPSAASEAKPSAASEAKSAAAAAPAPAVNLDDVIGAALNKVISKIETTKGRVAVMDFPALDGRPTGLSSYISNKAGNKLIEAGRQVVDRATLEKVISEQKLQQNSLMDAATAAKIGKLAGAGVFIIGNYTTLSSKFVLTVRALAVESGQFIPGAVAEETVRPVPNEMTSEILELASGSALKPTNVDLTGGGSSGGGAKQPSDEEKEAMKNEIAFDKKVCAMINQNVRFAGIVKAAYDTGFMGLEELQSLNMNASPTDETGESKVCGCTIGDWVIATDNCGWNADYAGQAIKGKQTIHVIEAWAYRGPDNLPGLESCAPKKGWFNERRGSSGGGSAKGKKRK